MDKRDYRLDVLRCLSMFLVIVIHVANCYYRNFSIISSGSFLGSVIFNTIARVSVPIFFMISGALLGKKEFDKKKYFSRIKKFVIILFFWTIVYLLWEYFYLGIKYDNLYKLLFSPYRAHLWFMYAIIGLYIIQPFVSYILKGIGKEEKIIFIVLWLLLSGIKFNFAYPVPIVGSTYYLGYFMVGSILYDIFKETNYKKYNWIFILLFLISSSIIIYLSYTSSIAANKFIKSYLIYKSIFMMISSISVYILILQNSNIKGKLLLDISGVSLGVYLIHGIFLDIVKNIFDLYSINSFIGIPVFSILIFGVSYAAIKVLNLIPVVRDNLI